MATPRPSIGPISACFSQESAQEDIHSESEEDDAERPKKVRRVVAIRRPTTNWISHVKTQALQCESIKLTFQMKQIELDFYDHNRMILAFDPRLAKACIQEMAKVLKRTE